MRIKTLEIRNLRSFKNAKLDFGAYTCLVGGNGAGKSTVLFALRILFQQGINSSASAQSLTLEDFYQCDASAPIEIVGTFDDLSPQAAEDLKDYVRQGQLVVSAITKFDSTTSRATTRRFGQRPGMPPFADFFQAFGDNEKVPALRERYSGLRAEFSDLPSANTRDTMADSLRAYEAAHSDACKLLPSADLFYGVSGGEDRLSRYVQWVFVPAMKDATDEQIASKDTALGKLLARTVRAKSQFEGPVKSLLEHARGQYQQILDDNQATLDGLSYSLRDRLAEWAHPDTTLRVEWQQDPTKSVRIEEPFAKIVAGEGGFEGDLIRFGHGFQRSFLLALLQELATSDDKSAPRLLLGCEEPELYQHPPQSRHLASVFASLASANSQVIVSTHSPHFISGEYFECVRVVRRGPATIGSTIRQFTYGEFAAKYAEVKKEQPLQKPALLVKVHQALQPVLNEMFFAPRIVLVEGLEDMAYLQSWLILTDRWESLRRAGYHAVPANGKSEMLRPSVIATGFDIPIFAVFDADGNEANAAKRSLHERDNIALLSLFGGDASSPFPPATIWGKRFVMWPENIGNSVQADLIACLGQTEFEAVKNEAHLAFENEAKLNKASLYIGQLLMLAREKGADCPSLDRLADAILAFAAG